MAKGRVVFACNAGLAILAACGGNSGPAVSADGGGGGGSCASPLAVEDSTPPTGPQQCAASACGASNSCTSAEPLDVCCVWVAQPSDPLADGIGLHRYSTDNPNATPDLGCLTNPGTLGTPQPVTLTGYVWLFSSGQDSAGVQVDAFPESHPTTPDGTFSATSSGTYVTTTTDPIDPTNTTWDSQCPNGCSYRQYTIKGLMTETPYVIRTQDATAPGTGTWATLYDYNVYFSNADVQNGQVTYDATAAAAEDLNTVSGAAGVTIQPNAGLLAGEVHDCSDIRLSGATVETSTAHEEQMFYFDSDESNPVPDAELLDTSDLSLFGAFNLQAGQPVRVSASAKDPNNPGQFLMLGTYVVQVFPGAVTALALRGRRPWQL
jgi:hypothetical protein